jgi:lipopolysaccharide assembly outer membrane protein LptD (OstA)
MLDVKFLIGIDFKKVLPFSIIILLFFCEVIYSQDKIELKYSDKLTGRTENGQTIREAIGNVHLVQGNVKVYCNKAYQYIDANKVELIGDVKIFQDTVALYTSKATYYGNEGKAICEGGVTLKDPNATLRANHGIYYFNDAKAVFDNDVIIVNPTYKITSDHLIYFRNNEDSFAKGNVIVVRDSTIIKAENIDFYKRQGKTYATQNVNIEQDSSIIYCDTLTDYSNEKKSIASGNVKLNNMRNNVNVYGDYLENYENTKYTFIKGNAKLVQVEKEKDTMFIYSKTMESYREIPEHYIAKDSVDVIRDKFYSKSGYAVYSKTTDKDIDKMSFYIKPIVWNDNVQMTGDTIFADLKEKKLQTIDAKKIDELAGSEFSFMIVENKDTNFIDRFDQVTGKNITIHFLEDKVNYVEVNKNSNSLYFMYDDKKGNGVNISEGMNMIITFDKDQKVDKVRIEKKPKGQYVPEVKLSTVTLTLPGFNLRRDKPARR